MTVSGQQLLLLFVSLFTLYSPLSNLGPYASLVGHFPREDQKRLAYRVFFYCLLVMLLLVWAGEGLFAVLGVNSDSLRVTGGIALMIAGLPMMLGAVTAEDSEASAETDDWRAIVVIPMTFPMSIGGTTAAYVVTASSFADNGWDLLAISGVIAAFAGVILLTHLVAPPLAQRLSEEGRRVLNRIGGIILVTIAVQLITGGLSGLFPGLAA